LGSKKRRKTHPVPGGTFLDVGIAKKKEGWQARKDADNPILQPAERARSNVWEENQGKGVGRPSADKQERKNE